tara:strand:- start:1714 stop:2568 length:855 start_codon:yes stop_codon:yes gene_type:complete
MIAQIIQSLDYSTVGDTEGRLVVYFHGAPGGPAECELFHAHAIEHNLRIVCFDRFDVERALHQGDYYQRLADCIRDVRGCGEVDGKSESYVDLIGFSIGAQVAIEVASILGEAVRQLHLVSAPAPLCQGDYLDDMVGGMVFKMALQRPLLFTALTMFQKLVAFFAPQQLFAILFASANGDDVELSQQREFKQFVTPLLRSCFLQRTSGYIRDVRHYVSWGGNPMSSTQQVMLWHGTEDNWSPYSMVEGLSRSLSGDVSVHSMQGASHYSCLYQAISHICEVLDT